MAVEFRVLGCLEVWRDGQPVPLGAFRQRALLGLLLANAGTVLSTDRILDELWGEGAGLDKQSSLWVYVSGLRGALDPARAKRSEGTVLLTRAPGYVLAIDPGDTDAGLFERTVAEARLVAESDPAGASMLLRSGLARWRGHAYEEFAYESWAHGEISRLEELRLQATEDRIDADLRLGLSRELISELHGLMRQHPLRERFVTSLLLALYRSGRAAEALRVCASYRRRMVAELGVEPSRVVRDLEHQILVDDPDLLVHANDGARDLAPRSGLTVRGYELRSELGRGAFGTVYRAYQPVVGREIAIKVIRPELADDPSFIRRFEAEAQLVARLEHPHIVPLYDYWREPGAAYLVMRLIRGGSLTDALEQGALPPERAAVVFAQLASALRSAHRGGVVHRDVKPDNILIDEDGNAYLTDFGVALTPDEQILGDSSAPSVTASYMSPEQRARRPLSPESDVYSLAVVAATALTGLPGEYEQVRGALMSGVRNVLDRATAEDPARRYADAVKFGRALTDALGAAPVAMLDDVSIDNPYKGLHAFGSADHGVFFGRERLVERLIAHLGEPGHRGRFVAVVGPSGSGKSSVVLAGLLPALAQDALPGSASWFRVTMTPARHPFEKLESALVAVAADIPNTLLDLLLTPGGLRRVVNRVLPDDHSQLLVVIDQFEELFTQVDADTAGQFIDELVDVVTAPATRVRLVISLRADYYDRPLAHPGLGELLRDGTEVITPMSTDELEAAITGPARTVGVELEPVVISEMISAVMDRPGALPLLQYTLTELFDHRVGRTITVATYRAGGGVSRTLARRADSLLGGLGPDTTETVRHVFLRLVSIDDTGTGAETRRRALLAELAELDDHGRVQRVLDAYGRHRLLSFDRDPVTRGPTVEISHEALLTEWTTLRNWIDDARDDLRAHRHLVAEMSAWIANDRSPDYLLRGERLDAALAWAASTTMGLRAAELDFLDASSTARTDERLVREAEERRASSAERRARRRTRQLAIAALATALVAVLAGFAWVQRQDAREAEADLAAIQKAQRLANLSVTSLARDADLSLLLAIEAVRATAPRGYAVPEAIDATQWALQQLGAQYDVGPATPTAARVGPAGVQGVWVLPVDELLTFAQINSTRALTADECDLYLATDCPAATPVTGVQYLGGVDAYANAIPQDQADVVIAVPAVLDTELADWRRNLDVIAERYGLHYRLVRFPFTMTPTEAIEQGFDADVFHFISPGDLETFAGSHRLLDVRDFIDEASLLDDYGQDLVSLTRIGDDGTWPSDTGPIHGVIDAAQSKALVWTNEPEFTALGYQAPTTWSELMAVADTIVAEDHTPFCLELTSQDADGWPATDWVEMVVLRTAGPTFYQSWIDHDVPFDDPIIVDAIRTVGEMVHTPGYLDMSPAATSLRDFGSALLALTEEPDTCLMSPFPSFMPAMIDADTSVSVGTFAFPTFANAYDDAIVGSGGMAVAVHDRPEVRTFMAAMASPDWGVGATQSDWPPMLPANARFNVAAINNPAVANIVSGVQDSIRADNFRFDASDSMPDDVARAFNHGMVRLFREGTPDNLDQLSVDITHQIENAWRTLEATTN